MKQAAELLQCTYRTIRYYKDIYDNDVIQDGRDVQLTERFIERVRTVLSKKASNKDNTDNKTKKQYREELEQLNAKYKKALQEQKEIYEKKLGTLSEIDYDAENERIEIFTNDEYIQFENALIDYKYQKQSIEQKEQHFKKEMASKEELIDHYKNQSEYQKQQSDRILTQMEKLIEAIRRRDTIEAVEKSVIGKKIDLDEA